MAKQNKVYVGKKYGVTGNTGYLGSSDTGEYLTKLTGQSAMLTYDEMRRSDSQVKAVLKAITLPILENHYYVEPASGDSKDIEIAEIIEKNLFKEMTMTWSDTLKHIMLFKPFGFSPMEKVYEYKEAENLIKIRKLDPRLPQSVTKWNYKKKSLVSVEQQDTDGTFYTIPIEKLCIFTNEKEGSNWEGISELRAIYGNWYIKKDLMKIDAIKHERYGVGVPVGTAPEGVESEDQAWQEMEDALRAVYSNEEGYIVKPAGWEIDVLSGGDAKSGTDVIKSIKYHDEAIALGMLAQFLKLGQTETGSRALGEEFIDFFLMSLQDTSEYICQVLNRFLIRELVNYNWEVQDYPTLKCGQIKKVSPQVIANLISTGIITKELEIENIIRNRLNLPEIDEEEYEKRHKPIIPQSKDNDNEKEKSDGSKQKGKSKSKDKTKGKKDNNKKEKVDEIPEEEEKLSERFVNKGETQLTKEEKIPDLLFIERELDQTQEELFTELMEIKEKQIEVLADKLSRGIKIQRITVPHKKEMFTVCHRAAKKQYRAGSQEMLKEIFKQRPDLKVSTLAEYGKSITEFMEWQDELIEIDVEGLAGRLLSMMAKKASALKKIGMAGVDKDKLKHELSIYGSQMSSNPYKDVSNSNTNVPFGEGRAFATKKYEKYIDYLYRSAILDGNLCRVCKPKNGLTFKAGTKSKDAIVPDPECLGGKRCRCIIIAVMNVEKDTP